MILVGKWHIEPLLNGHNSKYEQGKNGLLFTLQCIQRLGIFSFSLSPDDTQILCGTNGSRMFLFDVPSGKVVNRVSNFS